MVSSLISPSISSLILSRSSCSAFNCRSYLTCRWRSSLWTGSRLSCSRRLFIVCFLVNPLPMSKSSISCSILNLFHPSKKRPTDLDKFVTFDIALEDSSPNWTCPCNQLLVTFNVNCFIELELVPTFAWKHFSIDSHRTVPVSCLSNSATFEFWW